MSFSKKEDIAFVHFCNTVLGMSWEKRRWVEVKPYVAMWASVGLVPQRRPQDNESSVLPHEPHPTPWFNKHYKESSSCHHLTSIH